MTVKELCEEYQNLKLESINFQRAGIDDVSFDWDRAEFVSDRMGEIKKQLLEISPNQDRLVFDGTPIETAERQQDKFYDNNYLRHWIKAKEELKFNNGLVSGEIIYISIPQ